ncbi:MAG: 4-hydroxy-tetrahydrodipicolinate reductase [Acidobacteria bacterium]|nr:MAG: 4-hydroxy-tetrahydrodipicolinate reductase [Acidobacteriota bacterium]
MEPIRIAVAGAAGRMGRTIVGCVSEDAECTLVGAIENPAHSSVGSDAALGADRIGVAITDDWSVALRNAEALIDFTTPASSADLAEKAAKAGIVLVIGTTGFSEEQETRILGAAERAVIIKSGNMSLGANLLAALVSRAAKILRDFDVQIVEMHHRTKSDAPSGTALMLGQLVARARAVDAPDAITRKDNIGYVSLRGGTVVGEHKVIFAGTHERIVLEHVAEDRSIFARGAIAAAKWGRGRTPGLYTMLDVLGF